MFHFHFLLVAYTPLATAVLDSKHITARRLVYDLTLVRAEKLSSNEHIDWQDLHNDKLVIRASLVDGEA